MLFPPQLGPSKINTCNPLHLDASEPGLLNDAPGVLKQYEMLTSVSIVVVSPWQSVPEWTSRDMRVAREDARRRGVRIRE